MYITTNWYIVSSPAVNRVPWAVLGVDPVSWTPHGWGGRHDADKETFGETSYRPVPRLRHCWYRPATGCVSWPTRWWRSTKWRVTPTGQGSVTWSGQVRLPVIRKVDAPAIVAWDLC